jgi:hypothetical protein
VDYFFILDGGGSVRGFSGSWSEYRETVRQEEQNTPAGRPSVYKPVREARKGLSFAERRKMEDLMNDIHRLEEELAGLEQVFASGSPDPGRIAQAGRRHDPLLAEIAERTARWEELAERDQ